MRQPRSLLPYHLFQDMKQSGSWSKMDQDQNSKLAKELLLKIIFIAKIVACAMKTGRKKGYIDVDDGCW